MSWRPLTVGVLIFVLASPAAAGEGGVYESFDSITVGRVFLGPAERAWLDGRRGDQPVRRAARPRSIPAQAPVPAAEKKSPAAGYIIGSSGEARIWQDGDFVRSRPGKPRNLAFPGEVRITRHGNGGEDDPRGKEDTVLPPAKDDPAQAAVDGGIAADAD